MSKLQRPRPPRHLHVFHLHLLTMPSWPPGGRRAPTPEEPTMQRPGPCVDRCVDRAQHGQHWSLLGLRGQSPGSTVYCEWNCEELHPGHVKMSDPLVLAGGRLCSTVFHGMAWSGYNVQTFDYNVPHHFRGSRKRFATSWCKGGVKGGSERPNNDSAKTHEGMARGRPWMFHWFMGTRRLMLYIE